MQFIAGRSRNTLPMGINNGELQEINNTTYNPLFPSVLWHPFLFSHVVSPLLLSLFTGHSKTNANLMATRPCGNTFHAVGFTCHKQ